MKIIGMEVKQQYNSLFENVHTKYWLNYSTSSTLRTSFYSPTRDREYLIADSIGLKVHLCSPSSASEAKQNINGSVQCKGVCNYKMWPYVVSSLTMLFLSCYCYIACIYLLTNKCSTKEPKTNVPNATLNSLI